MRTRLRKKVNEEFTTNFKNANIRINTALKNNSKQKNKETKLILNSINQIVDCVKKMDIKINNLENKIDNLEFKLERKIDNLSSTVGYLYEMSLAPILHLLDSNLNGLNFERKIITIERSLAKILLAHWEKINPNLKNYSGKHVYPFTDFIEINLYSSKNIYITGGTKHFIIEATTSKLPSLLDLNNFNSYEYENLSQYQKEQIGHLCWKVIQLEFQSKVLKEKKLFEYLQGFLCRFCDDSISQSYCRRKE